MVWWLSFAMSILAFAPSAFAAEGELAPVVGELAAEAGAPGRAWGLSSETEFKNTLDKQGRSDGYEATSVLSAHRMLTRSLGTAAGLAWQWERRENLDYGRGRKKSAGPRVHSRNSIATFFLGFRRLLPALGEDAVSELLYQRVADRADRAEGGYDGVLSWETQTKNRLARGLKLKARYRYLEFLRTRGAPGTDTRQSRLELSPALRHPLGSAGLQNRLTHKFKRGSSRAAVDVGPFLKFRRGTVEVTFKALYTPIVTADARTFASGWARRPVYSAELEWSL